MRRRRILGIEDFMKSRFPFDFFPSVSRSGQALDYERRSRSERRSSLGTTDGLAES